LNTKIKAVLFDLDGTLFDTAPDLAFTLNRLLEQYEKPILPYETIRPYASMGARGLLYLGFKIHDTDAEFNLLREQFLSIYSTHLTRNTRLFSGMNTVLAAIRAQGLRWGVVTNKLSHYSEKLLSHFKLHTHCDCLIGSDMVANIKPAPDGLLLACQKMNVLPEECLYVGDAKNDISAAKSAGMKSIAALYGYLHENDDPATWEAHHYIHEPIEIIQLLKKY
jgi:2-phosphoglycolate phosphatase